MGFRRRTRELLISYAQAAWDGFTYPFHVVTELFTRDREIENSFDAPENGDIYANSPDSGRIVWMLILVVAGFVGGHVCGSANQRADIKDLCDADAAIVLDHTLYSCEAWDHRQGREDLYRNMIQSQRLLLEWVQ